MLNKLNLQNGDNVEIYNTNSEKMDGQICKVIGKSIDHVIDFYIVSLPIPITEYGFKHDAVSVPETCLKRV